MTYTTTVPPMRPGRKKIDLMPPLLVQRIEEHKIAMPSGAPAFDRVFVYPIEDTTEKLGSIHVPDVAKEKFGAQCGVVIRAGAKAMEELHAHGIELGHVVLVARISPWIRHYTGKNAAGKAGVHKVFVLRSQEIVSSDDLQTQLDAGELCMEMDHTGSVCLSDRERIDPPTTDDEGT